MLKQREALLPMIPALVPEPEEGCGAGTCDAPAVSVLLPVVARKRANKSLSCEKFRQTQSICVRRLCRPRHCFPQEQEGNEQVKQTNP